VITCYFRYVIGPYKLAGGLAVCGANSVCGELRAELHAPVARLSTGLDSHHSI